MRCCCRARARLPPGAVRRLPARAASGRLAGRRQSAKTMAASPAPPHLTLPAPNALRAVLYDIDGTLTHSDDLHFEVFRALLLERRFRGGTPIDQAFFRQHISGRHNPLIFADLFPELPEETREALIEEKEARFRELAQSALHPVPGLLAMVDTLKRRGIAACAVTNAPRANVWRVAACSFLRVACSPDFCPSRRRSSCFGPWT